MRREIIAISITFLAVGLFAISDVANGDGESATTTTTIECPAGTDGPQFACWLQTNTVEIGSLPPVLDAPATASKPAVRIDPPEPPATTTTVVIPPSWSTDYVNEHCVGFEGLLAQYSPGWDVRRMSGIMYRESRCTPDASNSCCSGVLQMHRMHLPIEECAVWSRADYYDPVKNICAAAWLWRIQGYGAWTTS